ncbi:hypothetical protein GCM10008960_41650 [Deinococcus sedimenti]|uniref:Bifunctional diguanylate cyclase/phosphodiesterase n=1 Tax=Deinococcus sedimenti TaxID=1867090 RepID=A0ABQ2SCA3_9DEIO|nr:hypothetical protein GCM10008960_41650 [Deinococcus sedimenti]
MLFIDLDRFAVVNDALGHDVGDRVLQQVARRLRATVPDSGVVARTGGDEFSVILRSLGEPGHATRVAHKLRTGLTAPIEVDGHVVHVTASFGVALAPRDGVDVITVQKHADIALHRAKQAGRNGVQTFDLAMGSETAAQLALERDLRAALTRGEFLLHYQPVFDVSSGLVTGFEALIRWAHPTQGLISPGTFIPVAEEAALIVPLGTWVLHEACRQATLWQVSRAVTMSVNVSALQFEQPDFVKTVREALRSTGLPPGQLILELTESAVLRDPDAAVAQLRDLRALGIRIALDDFGTGHSSLSLLRRLPIDALKIDRSFVQDAAAEVMVGVAVTLARAFSLHVVAEGIETEGQRALAQALGCDGMQGYLLARPAPADEMPPC